MLDRVSNIGLAESYETNSKLKWFVYYCEEYLLFMSSKSDTENPLA